MASNTDYLPDEITYGFVADRVLLAIGDTASDDDRHPDGVPAQGTVRFSPERTILYTQQHPATVLPQDIECTIYHRDHPVAKDQGYEPELVGKLVDPAGHVGNVALIVGWYEVVYRLSTGTAQRFRFQVRPEHTNDDPLWLPEVAPLSPTPSERFVVNEQVYNDTKQARDEAEQFRDTTRTLRNETETYRDQVLPARDQTLAARDQTLAHGITVDTSVGTRVYVGNTMIHGDTGWREIGSHLAEEVKNKSSDGTFRVYIKRENSTVYLSVDYLRLGESLPSVTPLLNLPPGFEPERPVRVGSGSTYELQSAIYTSGNELIARDSVGPGLRRFYVSWSATGTWPLSLPGAPA